MQISSCRLCQSTQLTKFLDLGIHPPSDAFLRKEQLEGEEKKYPLEVFLCQECGLMQLGFIVPPQEMFNKEYVYVTSVSKTADNHFESYADDVMKRFGKEGDLVIEMGSNDGTLLKHFKNRGAQVLGIDPSRAATMAIKNGVETINDFFCERVVREVVAKRGKCDAVVGANVFAHIHDLDDVMRAVDRLLKPEGIFVTEFPYAVNLIDHLEFDTIYHEHLSYFAIKPLVRFFKKYNMELFDVVESPVHGGSVRLYVKRVNGSHKPTGNVERLVTQEEQRKLFDLETYQVFAKKVEQFREEFVKLLKELKAKGKIIMGNGAPAKGNTLLNYCQIGPGLIDYIAEINPLKHYTYTPGMHIPVFPLNVIKEKKADYMVILPWNLKNDIISQEHEFKEQGGHFIVPLPKTEIV